MRFNELKQVLFILLFIGAMYILERVFAIPLMPFVLLFFAVVVSVLTSKTGVKKSIKIVSFGVLAVYSLFVTALYLELYTGVTSGHELWVRIVFSLALILYLFTYVPLGTYLLVQNGKIKALKE